MEISLFKVFMSKETPVAVSEILNSGFIGQGQKVDEFENKLSQYFNHPYVNTVNSCTSAIHLALRLIKDKHPEKDEVITIPFTCTATNTPILANGLKIVWADTDPMTCNIDLIDLEKKINEKTLAIIIVHWAGYPVDLDALSIIQSNAEKKYGYKPPVIEDCAHAFGSEYKGEKVGKRNFGAFSFGPIKHLTTGDGGALICPDKEMHEKAKLLRWYGLDRTSSKDFRCDQNISNCGYKFHMNDINATIGLQNFSEIEKIIHKHKYNNHYLRDHLKTTKDLKLLESKDNRSSASWIFTILVERKTDFIDKMKQKGIAASMVHDRNDKHDCFDQFKTNLPNTDFICEKVVSIPCGWWVEKEQLNYIINCIEEGW